MSTIFIDRNEKMRKELLPKWLEVSCNNCCWADAKYVSDCHMNVWSAIITIYIYEVAIPSL